MKDMKAFRPLNPLSDFYIRYLFGSEKNKDLLMDFVNAVLSEKVFPLVVDLEIRNPFNFRTSSFDKETLVDIRAKDSSGRHINVEIQNDAKRGFEQRSLYYWAAIYSQQLDSGQLYKHLEPTICINLLNSSIFPELEDFHSCFRITEKDHREFVLTEDLQIHFIELPKLNIQQGEDLSDRLKIWCYYLEREGFLEEEDMPVLLGKDPILKKARQEYHKFTADDEKMALAEAREKWLKDYNSSMDQAREEGLEQGIEQGIEQGKEQALRGMAISLMEKGIDLTVIQETTGLSAEFLQKLKESSTGK